MVKKERAKSVPMKMTLNQFLRDYQYEDWYLSTVTPREMLLELAVKLTFSLDSFLEQFEKTCVEAIMTC